MIPEIKIVLYILFIAFLFLIENLTVYLVIFLLLCLFFLKIPFKTLKSGWIPIIIFLMFTFLSNVLNRHGRILFSSGGFMITEEGVSLATIRTLRVFFMIGGAKIMMSGAKPEDIIKGLGTLLSPLEKLGIRIQDFFHAMWLTVACFPALKERASETYREHIKAARPSGFRERTKLIAAFLLPMFAESIRNPETFFEKKSTE